MKADITPAIADAAYTAILTDTGSFRFSNTNRRAFLAAADLCAAGPVGGREDRHDEPEKNRQNQVAGGDLVHEGQPD